jgi:hypothetical protein
MSAGTREEILERMKVLVEEVSRQSPGMVHSVAYRELITMRPTLRDVLDGNSWNLFSEFMHWAEIWCSPRKWQRWGDGLQLSLSNRGFTLQCHATLKGAADLTR